MSQSARGDSGSGAQVFSEGLSTDFSHLRVQGLPYLGLQCQNFTEEAAVGPPSDRHDLARVGPLLFPLHQLHASFLHVLLVPVRIQVDHVLLRLPGLPLQNPRVCTWSWSWGSCPCLPSMASSYISFEVTRPPTRHRPLNTGTGGTGDMCF